MKTPDIRDGFSELGNEDLIKRIKQTKFFHDMAAHGHRTGTWVYDPHMPSNYHLFPQFHYLEQFDLSDSTCLDVGTYDGMTAFVLSEMGAKQIHATCQFDLDQFRLFRAHLGSKNIIYYPKTELTDFGGLFEEAQFDLITIAAMMHHLLSPLEALFLARRLLKRGGYLVLESIASDDEVPTMAFNPALPDPVMGAPTLWLPSYSALRSMLQIACFDVVSETRLLGGRRAREKNYDRYTFVAKTVSPDGISGRTPKMIETHGLKTLGGIEFAKLADAPASTIGLREPFEKKCYFNVWTEHHDFPLQPKWSDPNPARDTCFRLGTEGDFCKLVEAHPDGAFTEADIQLLAVKYPSEVMPEGMTWGAKQLGNLFVLDFIEQWGLRDVLEIGAGFNFYFANHLPDYCNYATLDSAGFYDPELIALSKKRLPRGEYIEGLIGQAENIADESLDCCFSVSVIEHIPHDQIGAAAVDMYRALRPGGWAIHSLDLLASQLTDLASEWRTQIRAAGFLVPDDDSEISMESADWINDPPHLEPLSLMARFVMGYKKTIWGTSLPKQYPALATVLIAARKPI